jgi:threonine dehydrogenase-like Zn-dependent dehydrogenase
MWGTAHILGHEIAGCIAQLGSQAAHKWPFKEGDRVALEEYMPCGGCEVCRKGVNVAVNVTGGGKTTVTDSIAVAAKQRCTIGLAAAGQQEINVGSLGHANNVLKRANGYSYFAIEQAIRLIASGKYPLSELCTHSYGLADVGLVIRTVAGDGVPDGIHVSVLPWREA